MENEKEQEGETEDTRETELLAFIKEIDEKLEDLSSRLDNLEAILGQ